MLNKIKLIVGLLNPGYEYIHTRHNVGSWYINLLIEKYKLSLKKNLKFSGYMTKLYINDKISYIFLPNTFMNLSGKAIKSIADFYKIVPEEILIAHDELDLMPGIIKIKKGGSHNGHNGLKNVFHHFQQNQNFYRLRIGIGRPNDKKHITQFVLSSPSINDKILIQQAIHRAICYTEICLQAENMTTFNNIDIYKLNTKQQL
ncbi:MAG: aminoacyl-tRNA hydrolase [Pantoea sp. Brub]|nr:aminoacyl-tRNA hydrolase [Pantoea sp. Brub]